MHQLTRSHKYIVTFVHFIENLSLLYVVVFQNSDISFFLQHWQSSFIYHFPISYVSLFFPKNYQEGDEEAVTEDIEVIKRLKGFVFSFVHKMQSEVWIRRPRIAFWWQIFGIIKKDKGFFTWVKEIFQEIYFFLKKKN